MTMMVMVMLTMTEDWETAFGMRQQETQVSRETVMQVIMVRKRRQVRSSWLSDHREDRMTPAEGDGVRRSSLSSD